MLCGHQSRREGAIPLRQTVLRPGRHGKPHQGTATGSVCRSHQLTSLVAQSVSFAVVFTGLRLTGIHTAPGVKRDGTGKRLCRYPTLEITEDRRDYPAQHPPYSLPAIQRLSLPGPVLHGRRQTQTGITVSHPVKYPLFICHYRNCL